MGSADLNLPKVEVLAVGVNDTAREVLLGQAPSSWSITETPLAVDAVLALVQQSDFPLILIDGRDNIKALAGLMDFFREYKGLERIVVFGATTPLEAVELFRLGAFDVLLGELTSESAAGMAGRFEKVFEQEKARRLLYKSTQEEFTKIVVSSEELGSSLLPLEVVDRLRIGGHIDRATAWKVAVAFQEAITNAHLHGNLELDSEWKEDFDDEGLDKFSLMREERLADDLYGSKRIEIAVSVKEDELSVTILDSGSGFVPADVKSISEEPLLAGRGIALMRWGVDLVSFNDKGNEVVLKKRLR